MYETIKARYDKGYVTDEQLGRYVTLGVLTEDQAEEIKGGSSTGPVPEDSIATAELDAAYKEGVNSYE
ncbi:XkdX family protein [Intestinimonas timonensis]|uniref:XkdX family protein n=1 Tax=Intestinimonas timonensis TaxID=1689270 RepID=UPI00102F6CA0|nr:XkdX family protein [Intestinimonas timonensis]